MSLHDVADFLEDGFKFVKKLGSFDPKTDKTFIDIGEIRRTSEDKQLLCEDLFYFILVHELRERSFLHLAPSIIIFGFNEGLVSLLGKEDKLKYFSKDPFRLKTEFLIRDIAIKRLELEFAPLLNALHLFNAEHDPIPKLEEIASKIKNDILMDEITKKYYDMLSRMQEFIGCPLISSHLVEYALTHRYPVTTDPNKFITRIPQQYDPQLLLKSLTKALEIINDKKSLSEDPFIIKISQYMQKHFHQNSKMNLQIVSWAEEVCDMAGLNKMRYDLIKAKTDIYRVFLKKRIKDTIQLKKFFEYGDLEYWLSSVLIMRGEKGGYTFKVRNDISKEEFEKWLSRLNLTYLAKNILDNEEGISCLYDKFIPVLEASFLSVGERLGPLCYSPKICLSCKGKKLMKNMKKAKEHCCPLDVYDLEMRKRQLNRGIDQSAEPLCCFQRYSPCKGIKQVKNAKKVKEVFHSIEVRDLERIHKELCDKAKNPQY